MSEAKFYFGDIVVISDGWIGCIVKSWGSSAKRGRHYEVYVRSLNSIREYDEPEIQRYIVAKELSDEEMDFHERI